MNLYIRPPVGTLWLSLASVWVSFASVGVSLGKSLASFRDSFACIVVSSWELIAGYNIKK